MKTFLHVGCGPQHKDHTTSGFNTPEWFELRLDIDKSVAPDIIGTMTDMSAVETSSVDAIFSSHNIEHLSPHEVPVALSEFRRVLKPDGFTQMVLSGTLKAAGFAKVASKRREHPFYDLWAVASVSERDDTALRSLASEHFPG